MEIALWLIGATSGVAAGLLIHLLFRLVRRCASVPAAILGCIVASGSIVLIGLLILGFIEARANPDPLTSAPPVLFLILAAMLFGVLVACAGIGLLHRWAFEMPWWKTTGIFVAEVSLGILAGYILNEFLYPISDIIRRGSRDIPRILDSFAQARNLLGAFNTTLGEALLLFEILGAIVLVHRRKRKGAALLPA